MRSARAFMVLPSSISWRMVACLPVRTTCSMSPPRCTISARAAVMRRVPCTISTLPEKMQWEFAVAWLQSELSESSVIGWLRSELLPRAVKDAHEASAMAARTAAVRELRARGRFIASPDLGEESVLAGLEVGFHASAGLYQPRAGQPHLAVGARQVLRRQEFEAVRAEGAGRGAGRVGVAGDIAVQAQQFPVGADPAAVGGQAPGARLGGGEEHRLLHVHALVLAAPEFGRLHPHRLDAVLAQHDQLEIAQHVVGTVTGGGSRGILAAHLPCRPSGSHRGDQQCNPQQRAPAHARRPSREPCPARIAGTWPCAASSTSQTSRTAPSPARPRVRQCTSSAIQGCAVAGATDRPTTRRQSMSGRSSPTKQACSRVRPCRAISSSMQASLSSTPMWVSSPRSAPRFCATRLGRAVISATWKPKRRSCTSPWPSTTLKDFISLPALSKYRRPSVRVPSTSRHTSRT